MKRRKSQKVQAEKWAERYMENDFLQFNAWGNDKEFYITSKNGKFFYKTRRTYLHN